MSRLVRVATPLFAASLFGGSALLAQRQPAAASRSEAERGRALYVSAGCYQCHGYVGQGGRVTGPALAPHVLPPEAFAAQLRHPAEEMPPYTAKVLSDADVAAIRAYLVSLPPPRDPKDIALLAGDKPR